MTFDDALASRVRALLTGVSGVAEKKMFGCLAFLVQGNMSVGIHGFELIVRIEPSETDSALRESGVRIFNITGRPMTGWLLVSLEALKQQEVLAAWVNRGVTFARSLPSK